MQSKRILILVNHDITIFNYRKELVERLLNEKYEVYVSSPFGNGIERLMAIGCKHIDTHIDRHGLNPVKDFVLTLQYIKMIFQIKPSTVLTYTIKPNIYGGMITGLLNIPCIANITGMGSSIENGGVLKTLCILMYRLALRGHKVICFQNQENYDTFELKKIGRKGKKILLPGSGVNLNQFKLLPYPDGELLEDGGRTLEFIFIARIMKEKGIDEYLEAAKVIKRRHPYTRFHILGFCEESYETIIQEYESQGIIRYHGMQEDVIPFLEKSHCTIHPSYHEGMSNVCLESAAAGRPVITTNCSGCRETVDHGITGFLVERESTESLIVGIEAFIHLNPENRMRMGIAGRKKMEEQFDRSLIIKAYLEEIEA